MGRKVNIRRHIDETLASTEKTLLTVSWKGYDGEHKTLEGVNVGCISKSWSHDYDLHILLPNKSIEEYPVNRLISAVQHGEEDLLIWMIANDISSSYIKEKWKEIKKNGQLTPLKSPIEEAFKRAQKIKDMKSR